MAASIKKVSAASARAHTRKQKQGSSPSLPPGMFKKISLVVLVGLAAWFYNVIQPPAPAICGTPNGPLVTSSRIKLRDGRHLAYLEAGVPKAKAAHKIIYIHGFASCKHDLLPVSPDLAEELGIYLVGFDRAGYGESDPDPKKSVKSTALDIEQLADQLSLGPKFYVIGFSMGGELTWGCLKYISHRLAGAALIAPVGNYWWPGFPSNVSKEAYSMQLAPDKWAVGVAHYAPWLTYWWNTQNLFPSSSVIAGRIEIFSAEDLKVLSKFQGRPYTAYVTQQGLFESLHRDMIVGFGSWEFDPLDLDDIFAGKEGLVHLWHGTEDWIVPVILSQYVSQKHPWIKYHEVPGAGHLFPLADGMADAIVKALVQGKN
ncbi:uncharacterized protein LOC120261573 [Dioscorea cayenensis subsp. rotundata]|uniref:Uncharacterized protein LOC120261573 n=1 Tax=Dioscorea cayennensis subsp. rotundata TaxID=55577 RepID=A0AB40BFM6_DIOCR|nr:uncharacterized protein LOC120261573 [Dioscorea cayenensis subsp. rotundata]